MHIEGTSTRHRALIPLLNLVSILFKGFSLLVLSLRSLRKKRFARALVISVDNLSFGGTGKTTLVREIGNLLSREKVPFAIVSRGYRSAHEKKGIRVLPGHGVREVGDEAFLLKTWFPGGEIHIGKNRKESIRRALDNQCRVILLDDGFQSTGIHKDLSILLTNPGHPYYYLRNFKCLGRREDVVLTFVREPEFRSPFRQDTGRQIRGQYTFSRPEFFRPDGSRPDMRNARIMGFSALGDNFRFRDDLSPFNLIRFKSYPDHHLFTLTDVEELETGRRESGCDYLVCTEKDWIKLSSLNIPSIPLIYARNKLKCSFDLDGLILKHVRSANSV